MKNLQKLVLLHSNDMHGDFMAEEIDKKLVGGVSMLSGYVGKVRAEEENVVYCVAGDMFRGSVIDSEFKGISTIVYHYLPTHQNLHRRPTDYQYHIFRGDILSLFLLRSNHLTFSL